MYQYVLVTGSNRGERESYLQNAVNQLCKAEVSISLLRQTPLMETAPRHIKRQNPFLNQGLLIETRLEPAELLKAIQTIEKVVGRTRSHPYGPREIDIDIVWWSKGVYRQPGLVIPHPYNHAREWVRRALFELLPQGEREHIGETIPAMPIQSTLDFKAKKAKGEKIVVLTAYDYSMAKSMARTSIDMVLVGDSLGNVIQGRGSTVGVRLDEMIYHATIVKRGCSDLFMTVDMPFLSYHVSIEESVRNAGRIVQESGAESVKVEGGRERAETIKAIVQANIPVMGHLGLTPQSKLMLDGYKVQAKGEGEAERLIEDAKIIEEAGVFAIVLEKIPAALTKRVSEAVSIPTIGIGAGPHADGQVLVLYDMLGFDPDFSPRFVRRYANFSEELIEAVESFSSDVRGGEFPNDSESY